MRKLMLLVCMFSASLGAWAQSRAQSATGAQGAQGTQGYENEATREQRRVELRSVLKAHRHRDQTVADSEAPIGRHLSSQERAEMRQQLRQQLSDRTSRP